MIKMGNGKWMGFGFNITTFDWLHFKPSVKQPLAMFARGRC